MHFIRRLIARLTNDTSKKILGRWDVDYCSKRLEQKVNLSNTDHCGPCSFEVLEKKVVKPVPKDLEHSKPRA